MGERKTLEERLADDILTDNTKIPKYEQCKDCMFRFIRINGSLVDDYRRCGCLIFEMKPIQFYDGSARCEYYEQEKKRK